MFLASLPPGFPQNPNVLLIRTHPNPFPSVGYNSQRQSNYIAWHITPKQRGQESCGI
jgi:hypothetical protein